MCYQNLGFLFCVPVLFFAKFTSLEKEWWSTVNCAHNLISNLPSKLKCYIYKFLFLFKIVFLLFDFRKSEKERMREYRQELEEREEKLKHRPLLFQRVAQVVFVGI